LRQLSAKLRFLGALYLAQRRVGFLLAAIACVGAGVAFGSLAIVSKGLDVESQALQELLNRRGPAPAASVPVAPIDITHALPTFSSAEFGREFVATAVDAGLSIDEVVYALDAPAGQPYFRYRVTLPVKTRYADIRKFVAALEAAMPNVLLDSVRCSRENANAQQLSCDLAFSALFAKT
jgi:hypothetical protein